MTSEIIIDLNPDKKIIGIEFLDASKVLNVEAEQLIKPKRILAEILTTNNDTNLIMEFELNGTTHKFNTPIDDANITSSAKLSV